MIAKGFSARDMVSEDFVGYIVGELDRSLQSLQGHNSDTDSSPSKDGTVTKSIIYQTSKMLVELLDDSEDAEEILSRLRHVSDSTESSSSSSFSEY